MTNSALAPDPRLAKLPGRWLFFHGVFAGSLTQFRAMNLLASLFTSSIGKKILMALTGLVLVGFVTAHLIGNLQILLPPQAINL